MTGFDYFKFLNVCLIYFTQRLRKLITTSHEFFEKPTGILQERVM